MVPSKSPISRTVTSFIPFVVKTAIKCKEPSKAETYIIRGCKLIIKNAPTAISRIAVLNIIFSAGTGNRFFTHGLINPSHETGSLKIIKPIHKKVIPNPTRNI